jgi:anaerobic selenocysteine-containing dehydrogenase
MLGLTSAAPETPPSDVATFRRDVEDGRVSALYVIDPGPPGSLGNVDWVVAAREAGTLPFLIVQGVVATPLAGAADIVLPGAAWLEKEACYTNATGKLQAASRVMPPPGEALEDSAILLKLAAACGAPFSFASATELRKNLADAVGPDSPLARISEVAFATPVAARNWLQASNPMERWKWDVMFQDLPPVKFADSLVREPGSKIIPLVKQD